MRAVILVDNIPAKGLEAEWGLAIHITHEGHTILLDTGASDLFLRNANDLGFDLDQVECGVLSHAHYDHADGMDAFFRCNHHAPFYLQASCEENCFHHLEGDYVYDGIRPGTLETWKDRIRFVSGPHTLFPGVTLLPHTTPGLEQRGIQAAMYRKTPAGWVPDNFSHEQSLIFQTEQGLIVFNSCCHGGADTILKEAAQAFPGEPLYAIVGGFHLFETPEEEVRAFARRVADTGVRHVVTGHCTGEAAIPILREVLGDKVQQFSTGLVLDF